MKRVSYRDVKFLYSSSLLVPPPAAPKAPAPAAAKPPKPSIVKQEGDGYNDIELTGIRRTIAKRLTESKVSIKNFLSFPEFFSMSVGK